jgi:hypothetical protein
MNRAITQFDIIQSKLATTTIKKNISKFFKKTLLYDKVWKFDIKNIHPKYIKVYTDIDPTIDFVFPVNKIDRKTVKN